MVFCGIYPADGAKYPDLKDALEKLQLNDASLTFELETLSLIHILHRGAARTVRQSVPCAQGGRPRAADRPL